MMMSMYPSKAKRARRRERGKTRGHIVNLKHALCSNTGQTKPITLKALDAMIEGGRRQLDAPLAIEPYTVNGQDPPHSWDGSEKAKRTPTPDPRWI